jgi:hypothetical protein
MQYLDLVKANRETAAILEQEHAGKTILAPWPLSSILLEPCYGYVSQPMKLTADPSSPWDIAIVSRQSAPDLRDKIDITVQQKKALLIKTLGSPGKLVSVYLAPNNAEK